MKKFIATLALFVGLLTVNPARSAVVINLNGTTMITWGICQQWDISLGNFWVAYDCVDLGFFPPFDYPYPGSPPASPQWHPPMAPAVGTGGGTELGNQVMTMMDGSHIPFMSEKAIKKFKKAFEKGKLTKKDAEKFLRYRGKTDPELLKGMQESFGLKDQSSKEKLRQKGRSLDPASTCIDDIYNSRKQTWKKMGLAPLEILTGGLVGGGAAATGTSIAIGATAKLPEVLASLGMTSGSIVGTAALYGSVVGAVGMAAYVVSKEIYYAVKLVRNAKMIDLISQARLPSKYGLTKDFHKFSRKSLKAENPDKEDIDFIREEVSRLDESGAFCKDGKITSYRDFKKELKKRGKQYTRLLGRKIEFNCQGHEGEITCKAKEKANKVSCKSELRTVSTGGSPFFMVMGKEKCDITAERPSSNEGVIATVAAPNLNQLVFQKIEMDKSTTHASFSLADKNKVIYFKSRRTAAPNGKDQHLSCETKEYKLHNNQVVHRDIAMRNALISGNSEVTGICETDVTSDGDITLVGKPKEKGNKTKCISKGFGGSRTIQIDGDSGACSVTERTSKDGKARREFVHEANVMARSGNHPNVVHFISTATTREHAPDGGITTLEYNTCSVKTDNDGETSRKCRYEGPSGKTECDLSMKMTAGPPRHQTVSATIRNMK